MFPKWVLLSLVLAEVGAPAEVEPTDASAETGSGFAMTGKGSEKINKMRDLCNEIDSDNHVPSTRFRV